MMGGCRCSYKTCKSATKTHQELHFFHYPVKTRERCLEWIQNAERVEYGYLPNDQLRNKVVCGLHFRDACFTNELRKRLVHDAVPTLDIGCEPEVETVPVHAEENQDYEDMQQDMDADDSADSSSMNTTTFMGDGGITTIKATSGDGSTFSLDTDAYTQEHEKPHLITYNFVNGSLVPTITSEETAPVSASSRNGSVQTANVVIQAQPQYDTYNSIFGGDASHSELQYITEECTIAPLQSTTIRARPGQGAGRGNNTTPSTIGSSTKPLEEGITSYMLSYVEDPLSHVDHDNNEDDEDADYDNEEAEAVNNRQTHANITTFNIRRNASEDDDQSSGDCTIQLQEDANDEDMHILPGNHDFDDGFDGDEGIMVSADEIVPDNTQLPDLVTISVEDDDVEVKDVNLDGGDLFSGDVDIELLPPLRPSIVHLSPRTQVPLQQPPLLLHRTIVPPAKRNFNNNREEKTTKIARMLVDAVRPPAVVQARNPVEPQQRPAGKKTYMYVTTAPKMAPVTTPSRMPGGVSMPITSTVNSQRTTTFIKSTMPSPSNPRPKPQILRTQIQKIIQGGVAKSNQNTATASANKSTASHTVVSGALTSITTPASNTGTTISSGVRKRDVPTSLATLRSELPPSMYSAISIHLQRKRSFFDTAETEFLTTLYTSTPKGYTTLRNKLGWELPDEETVKELLELREN